MRHCRYRSTASDPYAADLVRRLRGLLEIVLVPASAPEEVRQDDEMLDRVASGRPERPGHILRPRRAFHKHRMIRAASGRTSGGWRTR